MTALIQVIAVKDDGEEDVRYIDQLEESLPLEILASVTEASELLSLLMRKTSLEAKMTVEVSQ